MTDDQLDKLVDKLKPDLRIAFRAMLAGELGHAFDIDGKHSDTGEREPAWLTLFLTRMPLTAFVESAVRVFLDTEPLEPSDGRKD